MSSSCPISRDAFPCCRLPALVLERFQQLADQMTEDSMTDPSPRPYEPKDTRPGRGRGDKLEPQAGDLVFFDVDAAAHEVTEIAYSSIWRGRVETLDHRAANAWTFFQAVDPELAPFHRGRKQITLAERVFGFVEEKEDEDERGGLRLEGPGAFLSRIGNGGRDRVAASPVEGTE